MAIRFRCSSCKRRLSVGDHKAGQLVRCPNCQQAVSVPTLAELATAAVMAGETPPSAADPPQFEALELVTNASAPSLHEPAATRSRTTERLDPNVVSISRRVLYAQGVLIAATGLVAFILGYLFGGSSVLPVPAVPMAASSGPIEVAGTLTYLHNGAPQADAGAVIILLPHDSAPDEKISIDGLRPQDPPPAEEAMPVRAIRSLGGQYQRSDPSGVFSLTVPRAGEYHLLLVSRHAERPTNVQPHEEDLLALERFFKHAPDLIAGQKYRWQTLELTPETDLTHDFGPSGQ